MDKQAFISKCNEKLKLIRTEYNFSQDKMADVLGVSKKKIVEIEKGRSSLGLSGAVAMCTIFQNSEILSATFGGTPEDIIMAIAFDGFEPDNQKTMGGKIWWRELESKNGFKIQQNIISQHYRILDSKDVRVSSAFELGIIKLRFDELTK